MFVTERQRQTFHIVRQRTDNNGIINAHSIAVSASKIVRSIGLIINARERNFQEMEAPGDKGSSKKRQFHLWNLRSWEWKFSGKKVPVTWNFMSTFSSKYCVMLCRLAPHMPKALCCVQSNYTWHCGCAKRAQSRCQSSFLFVTVNCSNPNFDTLLVEEIRTISSGQKWWHKLSNDTWVYIRMPSWHAVK